MMSPCILYFVDNEVHGVCGGSPWPFPKVIGQQQVMFLIHVDYVLCHYGCKKLTYGVQESNGVVHLWNPIV